MNSSDRKIIVTPSTALLNQMVGTSPKPRMLTKLEMDLLRKSKQEMSQVHQKSARTGAEKPTA